MPVFTGQDLCEAVRSQNAYILPAGGDCGAAFTQLQPVAPQAPLDVRAGETFFVLDVSVCWFVFVCVCGGGVCLNHMCWMQLQPAAPQAPSDVRAGETLY